MPETAFNNLLWVSLVALAAPLIVSSFPKLKIPVVVGEIIGGIIVGPALLGWVEADLAVEIVALLGLSFLLFVGGTEIDPRSLRGSTVRNAVAGYGFTIVLAVAVGAAIAGIGLTESPLLVAIALSATSLGVVIAVLTDAGRTATDFGQQLITNSSVADFAAVLLLSLLFAQTNSSVGSRLILLAGLLALAAVAAVALTSAGRTMRLSSLLTRLSGGAVEIQVRLSIVLMLAFAVAALEVGVESILGAFLAGAILSFGARDAMLSVGLHPKLGAVGYGFLIPVFFVTAGLRFDLAALAEGSAILTIPVFVAAILVVRGVPALLTTRSQDRRIGVALALLQATTLSFLVTASQIGLMAGILDAAVASAMVGAGLISVAVFPPLALSLLEKAKLAEDPDAPAERSVAELPVSKLGE